MSDLRANRSAFSFRLSCQVFFQVLNPVLALVKMSQTVSDVSVASDQGGRQQLGREGLDHQRGAQVTLHVCLDAEQKGHRGLIRKIGLGMTKALVEV